MTTLAPPPLLDATTTVPAVALRSVTRRFGSRTVLDEVSLSVAPGEVHALLGPNGAGKTTLLRIATGLTEQDSGDVELFGTSRRVIGQRAYRRAFGLVPSGDRSFYLRLSGLENLVFFGRLHGYSQRQARDRARLRLEQVDLTSVASQRVGTYSHGMQKRLSVARALLADPPVLFIDEATHDLDPQAARTVQDLVAAAAAAGTSVVWTTQRLDEIRGYADRVTVLDHGVVRFCGSVPALLAHAGSQRYLLELQLTGRSDDELLRAARDALGQRAGLSAIAGSPGHYVLALHDGTTPGEAFATLTAGGVRLLQCREERSGVESAFLNLVADPTS